LETGINNRIPPQSVTVSRADGRASLHAALLSCGYLLHGVNLRVLAHYWFSAPTAWFDHPVVFGRGAIPRFPGFWPPSSFDSAPEYHPGSAHTRSVGRSPEVFSPTAPPSPREPPTPDLPHPGLVASSHLPCTLTLCSLKDLPGVFQPGALTGFEPFRA
jgi:hypothetical protein